MTHLRFAPERTLLRSRAVTALMQHPAPRARVALRVSFAVSLSAEAGGVGALAAPALFLRW